MPCHTPGVVAHPSGTVTFLFTDVEGSTIRWERDPGEMSAALVEHDALLRSAIDAHGGLVFSTGGDGFVAAFADAVEALGAALEVQERVRLPVRIGLHTGTAVERDGNYFGRTLNRAARIMSAAHGGQIVVSDVTAGLIRDDADVVDLGEHRLAGVERAIRLWQVGGRQFPPLRTSKAVAGNLPAPLDSFVGRSEELGVLSELIATHRLVSVVGVGGMGKTRLAIEAGHGLQHDFVGGVWFVDLGLASSESAVVEETASLFGLQAVPGRSVEDRLVEYLEPRTVLLVFDNCEHVMRPAAGLIDRLVTACSRLKVVATSREALLLRGEHVMPLGPMSMGDDIEGTVTDAVALFVERLTAEGGPTEIDDDERAVVLEICRQLDGMPLAIELAAGRARTLGTAGVLERLGERLRLLSGGWRTGSGRQQTLSATLDWSYVLLDEREQIVFDRLAVFVGWFTLDDAVAVAADATLADFEVLDALSALVDKSMCTVDVGSTPARYRYLETMRAYGRDHLSRSGTLADGRTRHAAYLTTSARAVGEILVGPDELEASRHVERLMPDLRAALGWAVEHHLDDVIDGIASLAERMAVRGSNELVGWFYDLRHDLVDDPLVQDLATYYALSSQGDHTETRRLAHRVIEMVGDRTSGPWRCLGLVEFNEGHFEAAVDYLTQAYNIAETQTDDLGAYTLNPSVLGAILAATGHDPGELVEQAFARARAARWPTALAFAHYAAGEAIQQSDPVAALEQDERGHALALEVGNRMIEALTQSSINYLQSVLLPPVERAAALIHQLRRLEQNDTGTALIPLSQVVVLLDQAERLRTAALICGWLDGRSGRNAQTAGEHEAAIASVRQALGDQWDPLCQQGRSMNLTEVIDIACDELDMIDGNGTSPDRV